MESDHFRLATVEVFALMNQVDHMQYLCSMYAVSLLPTLPWMVRMLNCSTVNGYGYGQWTSEFPENLPSKQRVETDYLDCHQTVW